MKRLSLILCSIFLAGIASASDLQVSPSAHSFGTVRLGRAYSFKVTLRNTAAKPVTIGQVKADCSCTTTRLQSRVIPPKGKTNLDITYRPKVGDNGAQSYLVRIVPLLQAKRTAEFRFQADVQPDAEGKPATLDLGYVPLGRGGEANGIFRVNQDGKTIWKLGQVEVTPNLFQADVRPGREKDTYQVTLKMPKTIGAGDYAGKLVFGGKKPTDKRYEYPFKAFVADNWKLQPAVLDLGVLDKDELADKRFFTEIRQVSNKPFKPKAVKGLPAWLGYAFKKSKAMGYVVEWKIDRSKITKMRETDIPKSLLIETDYENATVIELGLFAEWPRTENGEEQKQEDGLSNDENESH